ncbi:MAG: metallophosphoesterase family protein [Bacillota bacterium]
MVEKLKFIHTADIHLGKPLNYGGTPPESLKTIFKQAGRKALGMIFSCAIEYKVDFVVIAGDLYDREARSVQASRVFSEQCQRLDEAGIPIFIVSGNHDPLGQNKEPFALPDNVYNFSSEQVELKEIVKGGRLAARILGQSYKQKFESRSMYNYYTVPDGGVFNLGILHTQLEADNRRYVPVSKADLEEKNDIHYWALGHIHQRRLLQASQPGIVFPGTPQGRNIKELGVKGCYLVKVDDNNEANFTFLPAASVVYKQIKIDLGDNLIKNLTELESVIKSEAEQLLRQETQETASPSFSGFKGYIVRWLVTGRGPAHDHIEEYREEVRTTLLNKLNGEYAETSPFLWSHSLVFRTGKELPQLEELKKNNELYQELADILEDIRQDGELEEELLQSWGEIWKGSAELEERASDKFYPDPQTKAELLKEAEQLILAELLQEGE